jgi:hypothetical protein
VEAASDQQVKELRLGEEPDSEALSAGGCNKCQWGQACLGCQGGADQGRQLEAELDGGSEGSESSYQRLPLIQGDNAGIGAVAGSTGDSSVLFSCRGPWSGGRQLHSLGRPVGLHCTD